MTAYNLFSNKQLVPSQTYKDRFDKMNWPKIPDSSKDVQLVAKSWVTEYIFANNELYCGKQIYVSDRWSSMGQYHSHPAKDETFFVVSGELILDVEGKKMVLYPGDTYRIPHLVAHRFKASCGSCMFIEVSTTHKDEDVIRGTLAEVLNYKHRVLKERFLNEQV